MISRGMWNSNNMENGGNEAKVEKPLKERYTKSDGNYDNFVEPNSHETRKEEQSENDKIATDLAQSPLPPINSPKSGSDATIHIDSGKIDIQQLDLKNFSLARARKIKVGDLDLPFFTPEQIEYFHEINFQKLVHILHQIEEELARLDAKKNVTNNNKKVSTVTEHPEPPISNKNLKRRSSRIQELNFTPQDNSLTLNPIRNVHAERISRNKCRILKRHAEKLAESLTNFERAIYVPKNDGLDSEQDENADNITIFVNPIEWKQNLSEIIESKDSVQKINDRELNHSNASHVRYVIQRSYDIIMQWKKSLKVGDRISASDWMDEYECNDENVGWTKLYEAVVKDVLSGPPESFAEETKTSIDSDDPSTPKKDAITTKFVKVGDSSDKCKYKRELQKGENAILVHYVGYPKDEDRWLMINPKDEKPDGIIAPNHSQMLSFEALRNNISHQLDNKDTEDKGNKDNAIPKETQSAAKRKDVVKNKKNSKSEISAKSLKQFLDKEVPSPSSIKHTQKEEKQPIFDAEAEKRLKRLVQKVLDSKDGKMLEEDWEHIRSRYFKAFAIQQLKKRWNRILSKKKRRKAETTSKTMKRKINIENEEIRHSLTVSDSARNINAMKGKRKVQENGKDIAKSHSKQVKRTHHSTSNLTHSKQNHDTKSKPLQETNDIAKTSVPSKSTKDGDSSSNLSIGEKDDPNLSFTWICVECREAECITNPESPLIVCEGLCNRPFHIPCAGLAEVPKPDEKWVCNDCLNKRHQCSVCHEYGEDDKDVYKCSKGNCGLFFHIACLNMYDVDVEIVDSLVNIPVTENDIDQGKTFYEINKEDESKITDKNTAHLNQRIVSQVKFKCPAHYCWTCAGGIPPSSMSDNHTNESDTKKVNSSLATITNAFKEKKGTLFRCLDCPNSFHATCIPPLCRFHELALLCHEHASSSKLPYLDISNSYQAEVERKADRKLEVLRFSTSNNGKKSRLASGNSNRDQSLSEKSEKRNEFLHGIKGDSIVSSRNLLNMLLKVPEKSKTANTSKRFSNRYKFCLPCDFQKEVHSKPPVYTHAINNRYDPSNRPKRHPPTNEVCQCETTNDGTVAPCDERCSNRMLGMECIGDLNKKIGGKNPYWNCNHGSDCGNRKLSRRMFPKCRPKREKGKGWGLVTVQGVKQGDIVQEYVGEIIDETEKKNRLDAWAKDHPNDPNFYIMKLEHGWYIDAREKGSLSRFINHSCDPNCKLLPVNVAGYIRIAIVAIRNIDPDEFLSYDYQFDTKHGDKFICRCGATLCRGTMKGGSGTVTEETRENKSVKKTKKQLYLEAKARFERDKKFLQDIEKNERGRLYQVGMFVPGECHKGSDTVASGPNLKDRSICIQSRVFLWRNAILGADFESRYSKISVPDSRSWKTQNEGIPSLESTKLPFVDVLSTISLNEKSCQSKT